MATVSMKDRLGVYGLAEKAGTLEDIRLERDEHKVLTKDNPEFSAHLLALTPKSAKDLRAWIGTGAAEVPQTRESSGERVAKGKAKAAPAAAPCVRFSNLSSAASAPPVPFDAAHHADMYALTRSYVLDCTGDVNPVVEESIDQWLLTVNPSIWGFYFNDVYVSAGASLTFGADVSVMFAHYVTVEDTGAIILQNGTFKFDLAGFKGDVAPSGGTETSGTSGTTQA